LINDIRIYIYIFYIYIYKCIFFFIILTYFIILLSHNIIYVICFYFLKALKYAVIADASGLNDIINTLRNITLDKTGSVREALYKTVSEWLLKLRDRYSYGDKLLPLLFAGIVDEVPKYQEQCKSYMNEIGALYEYDWEDRLKDQLDYTPNDNNSSMLLYCNIYIYICYF